MVAHPITDAMDEAIIPFRLLTHPFYRAWQAGTLTRDDLRTYASQYWHQVDAFPTYLGVLADRLPDPEARKLLLDNLSDELDQDHRGMWLAFASSVGASETDVRSGHPEPETETCVRTFRDATTVAPLSFALGTIYGYESQTPAVAATKVAGLREHYGIDGTGVNYFELHADLDVEHSRDIGRALATVSGGEDDAKVACAGARAGAQAICGLLDGVARVRGISSPVDGGS